MIEVRHLERNRYLVTYTDKRTHNEILLKEYIKHPDFILDKEWQVLDAVITIDANNRMVLTHEYTRKERLQKD